MKIHLAEVFPARHSRAGQPIAPIGYTKRGPIWPGAGGAPEDGEGEDGGSSEGSDGDNDPETETDADGDAGKEGEKPVTKAEFDAIMNRMRAADKRASEAEARLKKLDDAKKDELTKATERVTELETQAKARDSELANLRLQNAFLTVNDFQWRDAEDALTLAERGGYLEGVVQEDGTVDSTALKAKLTELAKKKPHLVDTSKDGDGGEGTPPATGTPTGSGRRKNDKGPDKAKLLSRYPSLNR